MSAADLARPALPRADGQSRAFVVSPRRLHEDIRRGISALHWAIIRIEKPTEPATTEPAEDTPPLLRAWALLPDGRTCTVAAWVVPDTTPDAVHASMDRTGPGVDHDEAWLRQPVTVALRVSVGRLGDSSLEKQFLHSLEQTLRGPSERRRIRFDLP
ncbi:MAG: hypothetical protein IT441_06770 [Phycisphaeraceae bacterium]|nr:hypothetical protein [Phycisphaeraceae bacterium]